MEDTKYDELIDDCRGRPHLHRVGTVDSTCMTFAWRSCVRFPKMSTGPTYFVVILNPIDLIITLWEKQQRKYVPI